jgi:hypothetical protein
MTWEVSWFDLGSEPNFSGIEALPNEEMAIEWAKIRVLHSSRDSFAFVVSDNDKVTHKVLWEGYEVILRERLAPDWHKRRVRP